jgi:hypothetical protein
MFGDPGEMRISCVLVNDEQAVLRVQLAIGADRLDRGEVECRQCRPVRLDE